MAKISMKMPDNEPDKKTYDIPSEGIQSMRILDVIQDKNSINIVSVKLEVCDGEEFGRTMFHRVNFDQTWKGFFFTRLFLKAIGEEYKGDIEIDTDNFIGKAFCATIKHNKSADGTKTYANIDKFEFDVPATIGQSSTEQPKEVAWEE